MDKLYIENRAIGPHANPYLDIVYHLYPRQLLGSAAIITNVPTSLLPLISKQWQKVIRQAEAIRASMLDQGRIAELTQQIEHMRQLHFVVRPPTEPASKSIFFATPEQANDLPPAYQTLYVTCDVTESTLERVSSKMPAHGLVVLYSDPITPASHN